MKIKPAKLILLEEYIQEDTLSWTDSSSEAGHSRNGYKYKMLLSRYPQNEYIIITRLGWSSQQKSVQCLLIPPICHRSGRDYEIRRGGHNFTFDPLFDGKFCKITYNSRYSLVTYLRVVHSIVPNASPAKLGPRILLMAIKNPSPSFNLGTKTTCTNTIPAYEEHCRVCAVDMTGKCNSIAE